MLLTLQQSCIVFWLRYAGRGLTDCFFVILFVTGLGPQRGRDYLQYYLLHHVHVLGREGYKVRDLYVSVISKNVL